MIANDELRLIRERAGSDYRFIIVTNHDIWLHSCLTGHDWKIVSNYADARCTLLHRHSERYPFHDQPGHFRNAVAAFEEIRKHDRWHAAGRQDPYPQ